MQNIKIFFYLILALVFTIIGSIIRAIKNFFVNHYKEIIFSIVLLSAIIPLLYSLQTSWDIPGFLVLYIFLVLISAIFVGVGLFGKDEFYIYREEGKNYSSSAYHKQENHTNTYYDTQILEKRKNGGLTDKEVITKKKSIRKELEIKKIIKHKEKV